MDGVDVIMDASQSQNAMKSNDSFGSILHPYVVSVTLVGVLQLHNVEANHCYRMKMAV